MANYIKATNFATKDALSTGNALKRVSGTEINTEYDAIAVAIASKADAASPTFTGTPTAPTPTAGNNTTLLATTAFVTTAVAASFPSGGIIIWSGSQAAIPSGWYLCNGSNGTPDLRDRFVVGAGTTYAVGATGGSKDAVVVSHTHVATVTDPGHFHSYSTWNGTAFSPSGSAGGPSLAYGATTGSTDSKTTGVTVSNATPAGAVSGTNANLPPYYALCYIMRA